MALSGENILNPVHSRRTALIKISHSRHFRGHCTLISRVPGNAAEAEHHLHEMLEQAPPPVASGPAYFSQADWETVSKLSDLIIPRTDTPGAVDAGVPHWIDYHVAHEPELQEKFKQGLAYLDEQAHTVNGSAFASSHGAAAERLFCRPLSADADTAKSGFFKTVKDLTIDGYYSSEQGLVKELDFKGNTFRASFPGCTHPEHWPAADANPESGK